VHSVVSQGVIASYAQKLNVHAVCERAASGQLLFLGSLQVLVKLLERRGQEQDAIHSGVKQPESAQDSLPALGAGQDVEDE
jgi:hypothetical protein